jgi:hypothetical protein
MTNSATFATLPTHAISVKKDIMSSVASVCLLVTTKIVILVILRITALNAAQDIMWLVVSALLLVPMIIVISAPTLKLALNARRDTIFLEVNVGLSVTTATVPFAIPLIPAVPAT